MLAAKMIGLLATATLACGCLYAYRSVHTAPRYGIANRPHPSYYCYDCHGYRFFDPYYDWCPNFGFVYRWDRWPRAVALYRERYVALKSQDRTLGRFEYPKGYRVSRRYREPRDYDTWLRRRNSNRSGDGRVGPPEREIREPQRGSKKKEKSRHLESERPPGVSASRWWPQGVQP